jgi:hypothetical protein
MWHIAKTRRVPRCYYLSSISNVVHSKDKESAKVLLLEQY